MRPFLAPFLNRRNTIGLRVQMFPGTPFPNDIAFGRHLDEIIPVHLTVVLGPGHAPFNLCNQILRQPIQAKKKNVAIAQSYTIMMMVRVTCFPKDAPIPISFEHGTALPRLPANEALRILRRFSIVEERASISQITVVSWRIGHLPT